MGCGASKIRGNRTKRWVDELTSVDGYFLDFEGWQGVIQGYGGSKRQTDSGEQAFGEEQVPDTQQKECMFTDHTKKIICGLVSRKVHAKVKCTTPIPYRPIPAAPPCLIPITPSQNLRRNPWIPKVMLGMYRAIGAGLSKADEKLVEKGSHQIAEIMNSLAAVSLTYLYEDLDIDKFKHIRVRCLDALATALEAPFADVRSRASPHHPQENQSSLTRKPPIHKRTRTYPGWIPDPGH